VGHIYGELVFQLGSWAKKLQLLPVKLHFSKSEKRNIKARYRDVAPENENDKEEEQGVANVSA
jgi:hypothetical protein